jgi:hypothetical protein
MAKRPAPPSKATPRGKAAGGRRHIKSVVKVAARSAKASAKSAKSEVKSEVKRSAAQIKAAGARLKQLERQLKSDAKSVSAYQKRILKGLREGKTLQQARGHKAKEHVLRREREKAYGLTSYQKGMVKAFAERQAKRMTGADIEQVQADMLAWASRKGYDDFNRLKLAIKELEKRKRGRLKTKIDKRTGIATVTGDLSARSDNAAFMSEVAEALEISDMGWLFYH